MRWIVEDSLKNFKFWEGAKDRACNLSDEQFDIVESILESDGVEWTDGGINDLFWFEFDRVAEWLGYKNESYFDHGLSNKLLEEIDDWWFFLSEHRQAWIAGDDSIEDYDEWWDGLDDFKKKELYVKHYDDEEGDY